jgi:hypothetical protein
MRYRTRALVLAAFALTLGGLAAQTQKNSAMKVETAAVPAAATSAPDAQRTRADLSALMRRFPPSVGAVLAMDHSLLGNSTYLEPYPARVAAAIDRAREEGRPQITVPDAGRVWWVAQMRARREAVRAAGRPITAVEVAALACATGLIGACFGAISAWFQSALLKLGAAAAEARLPLLDSAASVIAAHGVLALALVALLLLLPAALCLAVWRDDS